MAKVVLLHAPAHSNQAIPDHLAGREKWSSSLCSEASLYVIADLDRLEVNPPEQDIFITALSKGGDDGETGSLTPLQL
jgi:hypothetical protein